MEENMNVPKPEISVSRNEISNLAKSKYIRIGKAVIDSSQICYICNGYENISWSLNKDTNIYFKCKGNNEITIKFKNLINEEEKKLRSILKEFGDYRKIFDNSEFAKELKKNWYNHGKKYNGNDDSYFCYEDNESVDSICYVMEQILYNSKYYFLSNNDDEEKLNKLTGELLDLNKVIKERCLKHEYELQEDLLNNTLKALYDWPDIEEVDF